MGLKTGVEWAQSSVGFWRGCEHVSEGCDRCYAKGEMRRYGHDPDLLKRAADATFYAPLKWKAGRIIYVCPWSDFFLPGADTWRGDAWNVIRETPRHFYLIPTKRPENIRARLPEDWPLPNVGLAITAENQTRLEERAPEILSIEAALHFLSYEPALGPLAFRQAYEDYFGDPAKGIPAWTTEPEGEFDPETGECTGCSPSQVALAGRFDWVLAGGESGPGARPMEETWVLDVIDQCRAAGVAVFVKQMGSAWAANHRCEIGSRLAALGYETDSRASEPAQWPEALRIREYPTILQPFLSQEAKADG